MRKDNYNAEDYKKLRNDENKDIDLEKLKYWHHCQGGVDGGGGGRGAHYDEWCSPRQVEGKGTPRSLEETPDRNIQESPETGTANWHQNICSEVSSNN